MYCMPIGIYSSIHVMEMISFFLLVLFTRDQMSFIALMELFIFIIFIEPSLLCRVKDRNKMQECL